MMGREAANTLQVPMVGLCRDVIAPSFENALQQMLQQVNNVFQRGSLDCKCPVYFSTHPKM